MHSRLHVAPSSFRLCTRRDASACPTVGCAAAARAHVSLAQGPGARLRSLASAALASIRLLQLARAQASAACIVSLQCGPESGLNVFAQPMLAFTALERLCWLGGSLLGSIDPLWALARLTRLAFTSTSATGSWSGLSRLVQMRQLGPLYRCDQAAMVAALPHLARLTALDVVCDWLEGPSSSAGWRNVGLLSRLASLDLSASRAACVLQHLPASLTHLSLHTDDLGGIPHKLSRCTALDSLVLAHERMVNDNLIEPFPIDCFSHLAALPRLRLLSLESCLLAPPEVPPALSALSALTFLKFDDTGIAGGWGRLAALPRLQALAVSGLLDEVPALPSIPTLTSLSLSVGSPVPTAVRNFDTLASQTQLVELSLEDCGLYALPPAISLLTALTKLNLKHNFFAPDPNHPLLQPLHALRELLL